MDISEKAAYVKGLFDGMELDMNDKQNKILKSLIDLVSDMAEEVSELGQCYDDVCDQIDALDENVTDLEDILFEEDEEPDPKKLKQPLKQTAMNAIAAAVSKAIGFFISNTPKSFYVL